MPFEYAHYKRREGTKLSTSLAEKPRTISPALLSALPPKFKVGKDSFDTVPREISEVKPRMFDCPKSYDCVFCTEPTEFTTTGALMSHIKLYHRPGNKDPGMCNECCSIYFDPKEVAQCLRSHSPIELPDKMNHLCYLCLAHRKSKPKICVFAQEENLLRHLAISKEEGGHGAPVYFCGVCDEKQENPSRRKDCQDACMGNNPKKPEQRKSKMICGYKGCT
jgi:hypothetical protein